MQRAWGTCPIFWPKAGSSACTPWSSTWFNWSKRASLPPIPPGPRRRIRRTWPCRQKVRPGRKRRTSITSPALGLVLELLQCSREAGTAEAVEARERVEAFLTNLGYQVETQRFAFSTSALLAFPVFGAGLGWLTLLEIPLLVLPQISRYAALAIWIPGLLALLLLSLGLGLGWSNRGAERREDANLVATRSPNVRRWIVAHLDTKAQGHSMAGRLVAVWLIMLASLMMTILATLRVAGPVSLPLVSAGTAMAIVAGFLAGQGRLRGKSCGARDNGSGLLAALVAAESTRDPSVGILITSAEEFGLIGARYFAEKCPERLAGTEVVNFDTIDEQGAWRLVAHAGDADGLIEKVRERIAMVSSTPIRRHRLPVGILVDSVPLAKAGAIAITIARLDWGTFRKIHTSRDTLEGLSLESAVVAGRIAAELATGKSN